MEGEQNNKKKTETTECQRERYYGEKAVLSKQTGNVTDKSCATMLSIREAETARHLEKKKQRETREKDGEKGNALRKVGSINWVISAGKTNRI